MEDKGENVQSDVVLHVPVVHGRLFVDVKNGEPFPRKSILKSRSRENSVCSDTSESSAADFEERRVIGRGLSHEDPAHSDTSDGITEEDSPGAAPTHAASRFEVSATPSSSAKSAPFLCLIFNLTYTA